LQWRKRFTQPDEEKKQAARVYISPVEGEAEGKIVVNKKAMEDYFPQETKQMVVRQPLEAVDSAWAL